MTRHVVCKAADITIGKLTKVTVGRSNIILSRLPNGEIRALNGRCPHQGANLQFGCIVGLTEGDTPNHLKLSSEGDILRCPWHGFEFSLVSGLPTAPNPVGMPMQLRFYSTTIENGDVVVMI